MLGQHSLYVALDHELDERIDDVRDFIAAHQLAGDFDRAGVAIAAEFGIKDEGKWLQIEEDGNRWIYRSNRFLLAPHGVPATPSMRVHGNMIQFNVRSDRVRALRRAFTLDGHSFVVEEGITLAMTDQTLELFRNGLILISPAIFLMAGLAGHTISRRALRPVSAIAREAQRIHHGNLQTRLPELCTRDEVEHLSSMLNEMLERIESGVRSVRDFTAYASHELRTPVALIRTEADLALQGERSNRDYREAIGIIGSEAQRLSSLLDSLLFLARTDAGAEHVQLLAVDARRLCLQAYEKSRAMFQQARLQLRIDLPTDSVQVMADPLYLQRLLAIVLENAAKYTLEDGLVRLTLRVTGDSAYFEITDTGIGIPAKDRAHIFNRFRRGSNVQEAQVNGSGLGLALAAWIAERHGTRIHVESSEGAGSSFSWALALAHEQQKDASAESSNEARASLASMRI
jgi:signal transduction histidine kinase